MKYFGTDGIRGIYGEGIDELAYKAGLAAAQFFCGKCYLGTDTRNSGEALAAAVIAGLNAGGCDVFNVGIVPTPAISLLSARHNAGGVMVSASHNPPEYNGLKFFFKGYKPTSHIESGIEDFMDNPPSRIGGGKNIAYREGRKEYIDWLTQTNLSGKNIAIDCAYGAAYSIAKEVLSGCGANVTSYSDEGNGSKINCGVGALYPRFIASKTDGRGFAFDGDADRLAVTDGGKVLDGDSVLLNLAVLLKPQGVAGTVMNNIALENELNRRNIKFVRTAVGDKHISYAMRKSGFTLGGEQSGHYIISPALSGDALYAAIMLSRCDELIRLDLVPQKEASVVSEASVLRNDKFIKLKDSLESRLSGKGRLIVRRSGTEPKIRLMAESEDETLLDEIIGELTAMIERLNKESQK